MDIRREVLEVHSKNQAVAICDYIGGDRGKFAELMSIFFEGEYRLTQRAAWPISYCAERWPYLVGPHLGRLIDQLPRGDVHDAVKRNVARLLQFIEIPPRLKGKVYSYCVDLIASSTEPVAVRAFALTVAARIASEEPDLKNELRLIVEQQVGQATAAFHKRARAIL